MNKNKCPMCGYDLSLIPDEDDIQDDEKEYDDIHSSKR